MIGPETIELGALTRGEALLAALGSVEGARIIDVGCGEGEVARQLAARGATVSGYDPFLGELETDWIYEGPGSYRLAKAPADKIPEPDGSADAILFVYSLHHVPEPSLGPALAEARRVLKPSGRLCVVEPLAEGPNQYVMELYHDETAVRRAAKSALQKFAAPRFGKERVLYFEEMREVPDFDAFVTMAIAGARFNGYSREDVLQPEVRRRFEQTLTTHGARIAQPVRMNVFERVVAAP